MVVGGGSGDLSQLTRRYGIKVEEVSLAVGEKIGHGSVKSTARMNGAVVLFVEKVEQANWLVKGISQRWRDVRGSTAADAGLHPGYPVQRPPLHQRRVPGHGTCQVREDRLSNKEGSVGV